MNSQFMAFLSVKLEFIADSKSKNPEQIYITKKHEEIHAAL